MSKSKPVNKKQVLTQQQRVAEQLKSMKKLDVSHLKQQLNSYRDQLKHLINQKMDIQKYMQSHSQQYMTRSYQLQKITKKQQEEIIQLESKRNILKNTFSQAQNKKRCDNTDQIENLIIKKKTQTDSLKKIQQNLSRKVQYLKKFRQRQIQYLQQIQNLQQKRRIMKQSQTKDINKIKNSFQNARTQIKQITNKQIQTIQNTQVQKIRQKLSRQQQIKKQNKIMQQQIKLCQNQKLIVQNQCKILNDQLKNGSNDGSRMLLGNQASQTYQRSLRVIKLEGKVNKLKAYMGQEMERLENQLKNVQKQYDQSEKGINQKLDKLKNIVSLKQRDYLKLKACSQMVLNQRSSLQAYLLQVFFQNPDLNHKDPSFVNQILRKLFIKINSKKPPMSYKNYISSDLGKSNFSSSSSLKSSNNNA